MTFVFHVYSHTWKVTEAISASVRLEIRLDICLGPCEINLHDNFTKWIDPGSLALLLNRGRHSNEHSVYSRQIRARRERAM